MKRHKLLVVLQNPWAKGDLARGYNPRVWRREFDSSRAGRRLEVAMPNRGWDVHYANACPTLVSDPTKALTPDMRHVRRALRRVEPDMVLACGRLAEAALAEAWDGPLLCVPHPSHRLLTNALYEAARTIITSWGVFQWNPGWRADRWNEVADHARAPVPRLTIRQRRGRFEILGIEQQEQACRASA